MITPTLQRNSTAQTPVPVFWTGFQRWSIRISRPRALRRENRRSPKDHDRRGIHNPPAMEREL